MVYLIKNKFISLSIDSDGGSMSSLIYNGEERLWQGGDYWKSRDVVIFPIVGHAGEYTVNGKVYTPKSHGVARYSEFALSDMGVDWITLELTSNAVTRQTYPFDFVFKVTYRLKKNTIQVEYNICSKSGKIPFYVGGHAGMKAPKGEVIVEFENEENPTYFPVNGDDVAKLKNVRRMSLNTEFFKKYKTYQIGGLTGGKICALTNDGYRYTYKCDCPVYAFWRNETGGDYVCVEPWWGISNNESYPTELAEKPFINFADEQGVTFNYTLTIDKD